MVCLQWRHRTDGWSQYFRPNIFVPVFWSQYFDPSVKVPVCVLRRLVCLYIVEASDGWLAAAVEAAALTGAQVDCSTMHSAVVHLIVRLAERQ